MTEHDPEREPDGDDSPDDEPEQESTRNPGGVADEGVPTDPEHPSG